MLISDKLGRLSFIFFVSVSSFFAHFFADSSFTKYRILFCSASDKRVTIVAISVAANAQTNLIPNAGFETWADGKPSEWFIPTGAVMVQSTTVHSGSFSAGLPSPATGNRTMSPTVDIPVVEGKTYVFSGWYLDNSSTARFRYWGQFRNTADTGANNLQGADYSVDSPEWKFFSAEAIPNVGATVARAGLRVYPENNTGDGVILFDDVMVYDKATMAVSDISGFENGLFFDIENDSDLVSFRSMHPGKVNCRQCG